MFRKIIFKVAAEVQLGKILERIGKPKHRVTVLCFHRISSEFDSFWQPVYPESFRQLLEKLVKDYQFTTFENANKAIKNSDKPLIILSFDDGYKDFIEEALPILKYFDLPSNHNIVTDCADGNRIIWTQKLNFLFNKLKYSGSFTHEIRLNNQICIRVKQPFNDWLLLNNQILFRLFELSMDERNNCINNFESYFTKEKLVYPYRMMNWDDINQLCNHQVEIGSHTITHDTLPSIKSEDRLNNEILKSKQIVEEKTGKACKVFSLPNGQTTKAINDKIRNAGYDFILDLRAGGNNTFSQGMPVVVNRLNMNPEPVSMMQLRMALYNKGVN